MKVNKIHLLYGFLIGMATAFIGCYFFITAFTEYDFTEGIRIMKVKGFLGKIITLGTILNIIAFFLLLYYKKELMARGVVLATIILTIITLFL